MALLLLSHKARPHAHRLRILLLQCALLSTVTLGCAAGAASQSRPVEAHAVGVAKPQSRRADAARFRRRAEAILAARGPDKGVWGVLVTDAETGEVLYQRHADTLFAPASNAKLFSTALAAATLGVDFRTRTTIETSGTVDESGAVHGDVVLIGRGDPNLSNRKFPYEKKVEREGPPEKALSELADALVARGVRHIAGDLIADDSFFAATRFPSGWTIDDMLWSYGSAVSAIAVNDNAFTLEIRPADHAGEPAVYSVEPASEFYTIENRVQTVSGPDEANLTVSREPGVRVVRVSGGMLAGGDARRLSIAIEEPAEYAAALLARLLEARGVRIGGAVRARHAVDALPGRSDPSLETVLAERISLPLAEDIRLVNKNSQNLHAELMLLHAARQGQGPGTREDAVKFATEFFKAAGIAEGNVLLSDASGLSRRDLVTPRAVVQLLAYVETQPWREFYRSTLPVAGEDGTLAERMKNTRAAGRVLAKTGTVEHVSALSGYATTVRGSRLIFSIFGNNNSLRAQAADRVIDAIAVAMVEEIGPPARARRRR